MFLLHLSLRDVLDEGPRHSHSHAALPGVHICSDTRAAKWCLQSKGERTIEPSLLMQMPVSCPVTLQTLRATVETFANFSSASQA